MNKLEELTQNDLKLLKEKYGDLDKIRTKIEEDYPVQYLIGNVSFYGLQIDVDERVLIPRFETETLVEKTINLIKEHQLESSDVLEVGTGSGCISIALKKILKGLNITAIDISESAIDLAKSNAQLNEVEIDFIQNDIFQYEQTKKYDILISNPPYISRKIIIDPKTKYEPQNAIYADDDGLAFYKYMILNYHNFVKDKFIMAFEIGEEQGDILKELVEDTIPNSFVSIEKDLSNRNRYLFIISE